MRSVLNEHLYSTQILSCFLFKPIYIRGEKVLVQSSIRTGKHASHDFLFKTCRVNGVQRQVIRRHSLALEKQLLSSYSKGVCVCVGGGCSNASGVWNHGIGQWWVEKRWGLIVNQRTPLAQTPQGAACFMVTMCLVPVVEVCGMICCLLGSVYLYDSVWMMCVLRGGDWLCLSSRRWGTVCVCLWVGVLVWGGYLSRRSSCRWSAVRSSALSYFAGHLQLLEYRGLCDLWCLAAPRALGTAYSAPSEPETQT